jgi:hypothetical protein
MERNWSPRPVQITVDSAPTAQALFEKLGDTPYDFVSLHLNCALPATDVPRPAQVRNLHGATSCLGAMTHQGVAPGASAFAIRDPDGAYGTALCPLTTDMRAAAREATTRALIAADRVSEYPDLVWVAATPGDEEAVLAGIEDIVGADVPIIGGSAADNTLAGDWYVLDGLSHAQAGVVVSVLFPSRPVSFAYQNGYAPTAQTGIITKAGARRVHEIDNRPAMERYADWTGGDITHTPGATAPRAILSDSTMWPLGREIDGLGEVPFYLLAHPAVAHGDGSMDLFATVAAGEKITLMHGTKQSLIERAGRVAALARKNSDTGPARPAGALMIYCGGCMLHVQSDLGQVVQGVTAALDGAPFLGAFTFGEQGTLIRGGNRHGNLMISCIVFG